MTANIPSPRRDNHYLILRLLAATAVLTIHAFPLSLGPDRFPRLVNALPVPLHRIAVDLFFSVSGYLVTASMVRRSDLLSFALARIRRILPALAVSLFATVIVVGIWHSDLGLASTLRHQGTWSFLSGVIPLSKSATYLPGAFPHNPVAGLVNACLWTLPWEVRMYSVLGLAFFLSTLRGSPRFDRFILGIFSLCVGGVLVSALLHRDLPPLADLFSRFGTIFFGSSLLWLWRERLRPSWPILLASLVLSVALVHQARWFVLVYSLALPWCVVWIAHLPIQGFRPFQSMGDYSYGLYIYGFPIEQCVVAVQGSGNPWTTLVWAFPLALAISFLSWHFLERPCLEFGQRPQA